jgi:sialate O-acetylesterase
VIRLHSILSCAVILFPCFAACNVLADVKLPVIFGDHMVLQQEIKLPVWGTADAGEKVLVSVSDHTASTVAGADGKWRVELAPFPDGTAPVTMTVAGKNTLTFQDVLVGDVWVASGQSNMAAELPYAFDGAAAGARAKDPQLRLFLVGKKAALEPATEIMAPWFWSVPKNAPEPHEDLPARWQVCDSFHASHFSAVAYFFGRELRSHLKRPIGLIGTYWPGSVAEAWTSISGLEKDPPFTHYLTAHQQYATDFPKLNSDYAQRLASYDADLKKWGELRAPYTMAFKQWQEAAAKAKESGRPIPKKPSEPAMPRSQKPAPPEGGSQGPANLFNGMVAPIIPYAIKGVIWYQGESNSGDKALEYRSLFARLIGDWREKWGQGDIPFVYVQISHFLYLKDQSAPLVREAQLQSLDQPRTGMAVCADIPYDDPGHPRDKVDVGIRLALAARHVAYGEDLVYSGPIYQSMKIEGGSIRLSFREVGGGLVIGTAPYQLPGVPALPADKLVGFEIAGSNHVFVPAEAKIDGETVLVSSPQVHEPVAVRYGWANKVSCNLYNKEALPASPFRTDKWFIKTVPVLAPAAPTQTK